MSHYSWHASELWVIGYADRLGPETVPAAVSPIFQERNGPAIVMPPYRLEGALVNTDVVGDQSDLIRAVQHRNATVLARRRAATSGRIMWVDEDMKVHYEKITRNGLLRLAKRRRRLAERAAVRQDLEAAMQHINVALAADDTDVDSFAMKALLLEHSPDADLVLALLSAVSVENQRLVREQMEQLRVRYKLA